MYRAGATGGTPRGTATATCAGERAETGALTVSSGPAPRPAWRWLDRVEVDAAVAKVYEPYPSLRVRLGERQRSIYLRALAQATRAAATSDGQGNPSA